MASIASRLAADCANHGKSTLDAFSLPSPPSINFRDKHKFREAVDTQATHLAQIDVQELNRIDISGNILNTDLRLSQKAFGDLCHFSRVPVGFIRQLAAFDEAQALDVLHTCITSALHQGSPKHMIVDGTSRMVYGIVTADTYTPVANNDLLDALASAAPTLDFIRGWLSGPYMRLVVGETSTAEAKVGDAVRFGINLENSIAGDSRTVVADYIERLRCTNGAVASESNANHIKHIGDANMLSQQAIVVAAHRTGLVLPVIQASAQHLMTTNEVDDFASFVKSGRNGGSDALWSKVARYALDEAESDGRPEGELTLWNLVNGITQHAHDTENVQRKTSLEGMGYAALRAFGNDLLN